MPGVESASRPAARVTTALRVVGLVISVVCVAAALYSSRVDHRDDLAWRLLGVGFVLACLWQWGLVLEDTRVPPRLAAPTLRRAIVGGLLALCGGALWVWAPYGMYRNWVASFDRSWIAWLTGTALLGGGLDLLWGRWERPSAASRRRRLRLVLLVVGLLAVSAVYRLGNVGSFPGEGYSTQVEDLQTGIFGLQFIEGGRWRWEYPSHTFAAAAGMWLVGPTFKGIRTALATLSTLKTIPVFLWLQFTVGPLGAAVGTALLVCSRWDVIYSRIPHPNQIFPAIVFAFLAGPLRRGRPSAYVWLGFVGGYLLCEYIAYRPLILFILASAVVFSLSDVNTHWLLRLARPLITLLLIVDMGIPLFLSHLHGQVRRAYFDGLYRAQGYTEYYNPGDSWQRAVHKRVERTSAAVSLFFFRGDANLAHNLGGRPFIDPVTAIFFVLGVSYCIVHLGRGIFGLTVVSFLVMLAGTLVATGNFDIGRAAGTVTYVYALAGFGAAALAQVLTRASRRIGGALAMVLLTVAVPAAGYLNTSFLFAYWSSPQVRRAMRNNLALLSSWLYRNARKGERVVAVAPSWTQVLVPNDAMWLREGVSGIAVPDVETALRTLTKNPGPTLFVLFDGSNTPALQAYVEWLVPGLHMQFEPDPYDSDGEIAYAHLLDRPPDLAARIAQAHCLGVQGEYELFDSAGKSLARVTGVAPFIDYTTWSSRMGDLINKFQNLAEIRMRFRTSLRIDTPGEYAFTQQGNAMQATLAIDGQRHLLYGAPAHLDAGVHAFEVEARFRRVDTAQIRLFWRGPDSHDRPEVMPMYRLVEAEETRAGAESAAVPSTSRAPDSTAEQ